MYDKDINKGNKGVSNNNDINDVEKYNLEKYGDIINLPHYVSKKHKQMSIEERTAQFAPFAALTGYEDSIRKKEIEVDKK